MAALTDSYQPFSQRYPDTPCVFGAPEEEDEGDIVKSKPKRNSYLPLVNEAPYRGEETPGDDLQGYHSHQKQGMQGDSQPGEITRASFDVHTTEEGMLPPNGRIPLAEAIEPALGGGRGMRARKGAGSRSSRTAQDSDDEESDDVGHLEESTTALLRRYTMERNGRPTSIHLGPSGEIVGSGWLSEILVTSHKKCSVTLEEDYITWKFLSRKDSKARILYLSDVYAAVQGVRPQSAYTPLTPHSPSGSSSSHPLAPHASSSASSSTPSSAPSSRPHHQATNPKKLRRSSSTSLSGSSSADCYFTLYALRSHPGSVGKLARISFRCPTPETAETWVEQITHQMQNFGNRPRKLYVVVNPMSCNGSGSAFDKMWHKVQQMFHYANIHTDVLTTQHRFHAREQIQSLELSQYDGIVAVGGDGLFNEVLNGLLIQTQNQSGVNLRRSRFVPVTPTIRLGLIPVGFNNSICRSVFNCKSPMVAAAQIMLGCSSPMDISSVSQNNTLLLFSAGPMSYGFWSDAAVFSNDFNWMGSRRLDMATLRTLLSLRHFEAEIQFVPVEDPEEILKKKEKCFNRCQKCSNFDINLDSPSGASEKGASLMAAYNEVDRVDSSKWKTITGQFSSIMSCMHSCCGVQAPHGVSPYGHIGNGCTDLIMLTRCSTFDHARWVFKQRGKNRNQFEHPNVHIRRVKEFRFREIPSHRSRSGGGGSSRSSTDPDDIDVSSADNLVTEPDDDEVTNSRAGVRQQSGSGERRQSGSTTSSSVTSRTSQWIIDGDELPRAEIEVRVHRHLVSVFARGIEPLGADTSSSSNSSLTTDAHTDQQELV